LSQQDELVVLELHGARSGVVGFAAGPDLGHTER
jgi:beta-galactosidase